MATDGRNAQKSEKLMDNKTSAVQLAGFFEGEFIEGPPDLLDACAVVDGLAMAPNFRTTLVKECNNALTAFATGFLLGAKYAQKKALDNSSIVQ